MMALSLCREFCREKVPNINYSKLLGKGADGEVYITDDPNIVIKFSALYELDNDVTDVYTKTIHSIINYLISHPVDSFARIYTYECLGTFSKYSLKFVLYSYTMEKLENISDDEEKVFHTILSHEDRGIVKNFSIKEVQEKLQGLSLGFNFDENKVIIFYNALKKSPIKHNDIHERNIMKDKMGNFKMVDFDRAQLKLNGE